MISINFPPVFGFSVLAWIAFRLLVNRKAGRTCWPREILLNLLFAFSWAVFFYTLYPLDFYLFDFDFHGANLVPLVETIRFLHYLDAPGVKRNLVGNILLLAPLGFMLPVLFRRFRNFGNVLVAGLLTTLSIEAAQLTMAYRVFDIDDVILNVLGVLIGFMAFLLLRIIRPFRRLLDRITDYPRAQTRIYSIVFSLVMILTALGTAGFSFLANTTTAAESMKELGGEVDGTIHQSVSGKYLTLFFKKKNDSWTVRYFRQSLFGRYGQIITKDSIELPMESYQVVGSWNVGKFQDEFVIARSTQPLAYMTSGDERFMVDSDGEYQFSIGRYPAAGYSGDGEYSFIAAQGGGVALTPIH